MADIRCEAFYDNPMDTRYHPVRRREIYQAMQARVASGTRCVVVADPSPPSEWEPFVMGNAGFVVGSLDVSLHRMDTGKRRSFDALTEMPLLAYISSMAVRPHWKRRGLARALLTYSDDMLLDLGLKEVFLHVDWENDPAVQLYSQCGFSVVRTPMPDWVHALAKEEHILMTKRLVLR